VASFSVMLTNNFPLLVILTAFFSSCPVLFCLLDPAPLKEKIFSFLVYISGAPRALSSDIHLMSFCVAYLVSPFFFFQDISCCGPALRLCFVFLDFTVPDLWMYRLRYKICNTPSFLDEAPKAAGRAVKVNDCVVSQSLRPLFRAMDMVPDPTFLRL